MMNKYAIQFIYVWFSLSIFITPCLGQIESTFNINNEGQRVCLVDAEVINNNIQLNFLDAALNSTGFTSVYRRPLYGNGDDWILQVENLDPVTTSWLDANVQMGEVWEYQVRRTNNNGDAIGYVAASLFYDQSDYRGQMILVISDDLVAALPDEIRRLRKDLTGDGWFVNELIIPKGGESFDYGDQVVSVKNEIVEVYNNADADDKPKVLFTLGNVPLPRSGQGLQPPDGHIEASGARGSDVFYADIDGIFTDTATYDVPAQNAEILKNYPGDYKWDQDVIPSELEMAFGRVNFHRSVDGNVANEIQFMKQYLDRLHDFRYITSGSKLGTKSGFYANGYSNSTDASYRSLPALSGGNNITNSGISQESGHCEWVHNNGPFLWYMQNQFVPQLTEWENFGMKSLVFSSDQSYWGYGDLPNNGSSSGWASAVIRRILSYDNSECLIALWTTSAINVFHQAGVGEPLGYACKQIMDHNEENQNLEKVQQDWDTPEWWNRTHFNFFGDPTLRLYQSFPASDLILVDDNILMLQWTASSDQNLLGYHVYKSDQEFGIYQKLTNSPIVNTNFSDPNFIDGEWYMVRAIAEQTTGTGIFINPSHGIFIQGETLTSSKDLEYLSIDISPNPVSRTLNIKSQQGPKKIEVWDITGTKIITNEHPMKRINQIDLSHLSSGKYIVKVYFETSVLIRPIVKI